MHQPSFSFAIWEDWDKREKGSGAKDSHGSLSRIVFEVLHKLIYSLNSQFPSFLPPPPIFNFISSYQYSSKRSPWAGQRVHHAWTSPRPQNKDISHVLVGSPIFLITTSCPRWKPPVPGSRACLAGLSCSQGCCRNWEPGVKLCRTMPVKKNEQNCSKFFFFIPVAICP